MVRLIIGGIAERVDFAFEEIDDLQLAVERLLAEAGKQRTCALTFEVGEGRRAHARGPAQRARRRRCASATARPPRARSPSSASSQTVVDSFGVEEVADGGIVVRLGEAAGPWLTRLKRRLGGRSPTSAPARRTASSCAATTRVATTSAREELIERHLPLVRSLARRYAGRGESLEDIEQVGAIGLIKAIDRFELERDVSLATYATPNVVGEIKRHFRDKGWAIRVPRALQELNASMSGAIERLTVKLARSPSIAEIAAELETTPEQVLEALEVGSAYSTVSLSTRPERRRGARPDGDDRLGGRGVRALRAARRARARAASGCPRASARSCACASRRACRRPRSRSGWACRRCTSRA